MCKKKQMEDKIKKTLALLSKIGVSYMLKIEGVDEQTPEFNLQSLSYEQQAIIQETYKNISLKPNL